MREFLTATCLAALPLIFAALGAALSQWSGVVNISVEGTLLAGALGAAWGTVVGGGPVVGLGLALLVGTTLGFLFGLLCGWKGADPIVGGLAMNLFSLGGTGALYRLWLGKTGSALSLPTLPMTAFLGLALFLALLTHGFLFQSRWGLVLRACGEAPAVAEEAGIKVASVRLWACAGAGLLAGLGGASLSLCLSNTFIEGMSAGRGFVALAIVILGGRRPLGILASALFFGAAWSLQFILQAAGDLKAYQFFLMLPYAATLALLVLKRGPREANS